MAANDRKRAMRNGQYWVFKELDTLCSYFSIALVVMKSLILTIG